VADGGGRSRPGSRKGKKEIRVSVAHPDGVAGRKRKDLPRRKTPAELARKDRV